MYLLEQTNEAQQMRDHVRQLLASETLENVQLACQLIKGGGMHPSFFLPIWAVYYDMPKKQQRILRGLMVNMMPKDLGIFGETEISNFTVTQLLHFYEQLLAYNPEFFNANEFIKWIFPKLEPPEMDIFDYFYDKAPAMRLFMLQTTMTYSDSYALHFWASKRAILPPEVGELKDLVRLNIAHSAINALPESFFNLKKLRYFEYEDTPLEKNTEVLKQIKKRMPVLEAQKLFLEAKTNYYNTKYELAANKMKKVVKLYEEDFEFWQWFGEAHRMADKKELALEGFERAYKIKPYHAFVWAKLAEVRCGAGKHEEALEMCEIFHQKMTNFEDYANYEDDILFVQGLALFWLKRYDESLVAYEKSLVLNDYAGAWYNKACSYSKKNMKTEMLAHLRKTFEMDWEGYYNFCLKDEDKDFEAYYEDEDFKNLLEAFKKNKK